MLTALGILGLNIVGSFIGVGLWHTLHMDDIFAAHHERVEARRAYRRESRARDRDGATLNAAVMKKMKKDESGALRRRTPDGDTIGDDPLGLRR